MKGVWLNDQKMDLDLSLEWKLQSITNLTRRGFLPTELLQDLVCRNGVTAEVPLGYFLEYCQQQTTAYC
jgi:hypothetical protein